MLDIGIKLAEGLPFSASSSTRERFYSFDLLAVFFVLQLTQVVLKPPLGLKLKNAIAKR